VPAIDVPPLALDAVLTLLAHYLPSRDVCAMGSRVTGRAKPHSDLDLVIMGDDPLDLGTLAGLRDAFDESTLPFAVDIVEWALASDTFRKVIAAQAQPLRAGTPTTPRSTPRDRQPSSG
jgi:uncharacterized protein